jgi:hypothetical protein
MLLCTELLTEEERAEALDVVPWRRDVHGLAGQVYSSLKNQAVDLIDTSLGPNHVRAAVVALFEAVDLILEATIDLAESVAREKYLARVTPLDPLGGDPLSSPEELARVPWRFAKFALEDAATRAVTAGDHLANAHVRLAWEANAATRTEVESCGFDPDGPEPDSWITVPKLAKGLRNSGKSAVGVFAAFAPNEAFQAYNTPEVRRVRVYRNEVIHRARPTYRESPALGRTTLWTSDRFSLTFPPAAPAEEVISISDRRRDVGEALRAVLDYASALWDYSVRWLRSVDVWITSTGEEVEVQTKQGGGTPRFPREQRDPGPFLSVGP